MQNEFGNLISIIVPIYNAEEYLSKCLISISEQQFRNFEVILINDGSSDNSRQICDEYIKLDKRFKVIHYKNNQGVGVARQKGLSISKGQYIGFVDADDYIDKAMYLKLYNCAIVEQADIVICDYYIEIDGSIKKANTFQHFKVFKPKEIMNYLANDTFKSFLTRNLYRRDLFNGIRIPNVKIFEDFIVFHEIAHKSTKIVYINDALYYYVRNNNSLVNTLNVEKEYSFFRAWYKRRMFLDRYYDNCSKYTYNNLVNCAINTYFLDRYINKKHLYGELTRKFLIEEFNKMFFSSAVTLKNKLRLLMVITKFNLYKIYMPKRLKESINLFYVSEQNERKY